MATTVFYPAQPGPLLRDAPDIGGTRTLPHNITTSLNYWKDPGDGSPPTPIIVGGNNIKNERPTVSHPVTVTDISGEEDKYTLDTYGFQYLRYASKEKEFINEATIKAEYYRECEQLLKDVTGANRIFIFDHKVRRGPTQWHHLGVQNLANRGPVTRVHVDQSYDGAEMLLRWNLPDEADELVKRRYQIINIWRPIRTIRKDPIAVADARSIPDRDMVPAAIFYPGRRGGTWTVRPGPEHRWFFKYRLTPDEVLLIKCFDSSSSSDTASVGVARRTPHSAFEDPEEVAGESRQSVEVRCLVFYDEWV